MTGEPKNSVPQPATVSGAPSASRLSSPTAVSGMLGEAMSPVTWTSAASKVPVSS